MLTCATRRGCRSERSRRHRSLRLRARAATTRARPAALHGDVGGQAAPAQTRSTSRGRWAAERPCPPEPYFCAHPYWARAFFDPVAASVSAAPQSTARGSACTRSGPHLRRGRTHHGCGNGSVNRESRTTRGATTMPARCAENARKLRKRCWEISRESKTLDLKTGHRDYSSGLRRPDALVLESVAAICSSASS